MSQCALGNASYASKYARLSAAVKLRRRGRAEGSISFIPPVWARSRSAKVKVIRFSDPFLPWGVKNRYTRCLTSP